MWESRSFGNDQGGFFNSSVSESPAEKPKSARRSQNIVPVCVRQILESTEDGMKIGSVEVHMFTMVVLVRSVDVQTTKVTYLLEDGTGSISGIFWLDSSDNDKPRALPDVSENMYCRIFGSMRANQGKKNIFIYRIVRLSSLNDLTRHILEVMYCPLKIETLTSTESVQAPTSMNNSDVNNSSLYNTSTSANPTGFNPQQLLIYEAIMKNTKDVGAHKDEIMKAVAGKMSPREVMNVMDFLCNEGHIYTTVDDEHYRCTEN